MADDGTTILIRSIETFSKRLYFTIAYEKANYYISPFCIHAMLSMLCAGSQGDTQQELHRLQYLENQQVHPNAYRNIFHNLLDVTNFKLELYNKICMQEKYHLLDSFKTLIANDYIAEIDLINFINNINMTHRINSWCELRTASKIRDLVIASDFDALTRMVLLSAAFFGGNWLYDFPVSSTKTGSFNLTHTNSVGCEMMSIGGHLYYTENKELRSEILKLPFVNQRFSMLILLPTSVYGIEYLERQLRHVTFRELIGTLDNTDHVEVLLPKFKIEYKINLTDNLRMVISVLFLYQLTVNKIRKIAHAILFGQM